MDDGISGDFVSIVGLTTNSMLTAYTVTSNIIKGNSHRFRYRAKNLVGWGPLSANTAILAARVPSAPAKPEFLSFDAGVLYIKIPRVSDNGGSAVIAYELYVDEGDDFTSPYSKVTNYVDNSIEYQATAATDGLEAGKTYRFYSRAQNIIGWSTDSYESYIAFGDVPNIPNAPTRVYSTKTAIKV